jgi:hypothetical protein
VSGRVTNRVAIVEAVKVRDIRIGVTPRAVLVCLLDDPTELTLDDPDGTGWMLNYCDLHGHSFISYPQGTGCERKIQ